MTTKQVRSIEELRNAYMAGEFKTKLEYVSSMAKLRAGHVFDENQSVKWNRDQLELHNEEIDKKIKAYRDDNSRLSSELHEETIQSLQNDYGLNKEQAEKIQGYAYTEYHSSMHDYFYHLDELAKLMKDVIEMGAK